MKTINTHIKEGKFKPVYLLYGEERYLVEQFRDKLKKALVNEDDTMNFALFEGDGIDVKEVIDFSDTLPFLAERRVVLIEDSGFLKASNDEICNYIKHMPETTVIIFVEKEVDRRNKVYKAIKDVGYICEMNSLNPADIRKWIVLQFKACNKQIDGDALELLMYKTGVSMLQISGEIQKLVSYVGVRSVIAVNDVEEIVSTVVTNKVFDMITAMSNKKQKEALELYYDLLTLKEAPLRILFLISRQFNILMKIKEMSGRYVDESTMSKTLDIPSFIVKKCRLQSDNFSSGTLYNAVRTCVDTEERIKTGRLEERLGVELVIVKFSS